MLHEQTLFISLIGFTLLSTLLLSAAAAYANAPREQGLWAWGNVASCAGLLVGGWGGAPLWLHAVASYGLIGLGLALVLRGVRVFLGLELDWRWLALIAFGALPGPAWFAYGQPSLEWRLIVTGLYFGLLNLGLGWQLRRARAEDFVAVAQIGFWALGSCLLLRAVVLLGQPQAGDPLLAHTVTLSLLVITLAQVTIAFGFILMVARRHAISLQRLAVLDALTGVLNRKGLEAQGQRLLRRARQSQRALCLVMIDADHFKAINDRHGHPVGDLVIRHLAAQLGQGLRPGDLLARYGGEEFLLLLDGLDREAGARVAERLRQRIEATPLVDGELHLPYTVSLGLAVAADHGWDLERTLAAADAALYRAKEQGRNRVAL